MQQWIVNLLNWFSLRLDLSVKSEFLSANARALLGLMQEVF
jgi:hypothetical protein